MPDLAGVGCGHIPHAVTLLSGTGMKAGFPSMYVSEDTLVEVSVGKVSVPTSQIEVFPNPAETELMISVPSVIRSISIYNMVGQKVHYSCYNSSFVKVEISHLPQGSYFIKINDAQMLRFIKK